MSETFEEFRRSFSYGSRSNLDFKFLKHLTDEEASDFLALLLSRLGDAYDTGDVLPLIDAAYEAQVAGYASRPGTEERWSYDDRPFAPVQKPLAESRLGLVTSSGHFVAGDDPEPLGIAGMTQQEAEDRISDFLRVAPDLSTVPAEAEDDMLRVRHGGYNVRSVAQDANVAFPRSLLAELAAEGRIGELAPEVFSFVGATAQGRLRKLIPDWVERFRDDRIDVLLLVPV